ncbi:MAG: SEC-C domain-containing protein [Terriglobia bacterium]|nr:SEC-C domain-containing protein [Terriglobia bacterium]
MKIGPNQKCPCGSGLKYKRCHGSPVERVMLKSPFELEKRIYGTLAPETKAVLKWCSEAAVMPLRFGIKIFHDGMASMDKQEVDPWDPRGVVLGFHAKGIDQLFAIRALIEAGSVGPAIGQVRTFFETYLYQAHILEKDTETRVKSYRAFYKKEDATWTNRMVALGDKRIAHVANVLAEESKQLGGNRAWTGKTLEKLASDFGVGKLYVTIYRAACAATHATDVETCYNPFLIQFIKEHGIHNQATFVSNYGLFSSTDVAGFWSYLQLIPYVFFGNTASFLNLKLSQEEEALVKNCRTSLSDQRTTISSSIDELAKAYPGLSMSG